MSNLRGFTEFLKTVDLKGYRKKTSKIKIVEMDMPRNIQILSLLYEVYWTNEEFIPFEEFYKRYRERYTVELEAFRIETTLCNPDFYRGLEARIYRAWSGLITQVHAGFVAASVFGDDAVSMSEELDHQNADIRIEYKDRILSYQIKKESYSGVKSSRPLSKGKPIPNEEQIEVFYQVPNDDIFNNPKTKKGVWRIPYTRFMDNKILRRLDNGFIIFTDYLFAQKKAEIDAKSK